MKHLIIIFIMFSYLESNSQILIDEYSKERDITFLNFECNSGNMLLKRVLTSIGNGESYSIRKGKELLIAINEDNQIRFKFNEIDGYSSLFLEKEKFNRIDINKDGKNELLIEINPFESPNTLWIYSIDDNCNYHFINNLILNKYQVINDEIIITKSLISEILVDDTDTRFMSIFNKLDLNKFEKVDYYKLIDSRLVSTNNLHPKVINEKIENYNSIITELHKIYEVEPDEFEKKNIVELLDFLNEIINSYK